MLDDHLPDFSGKHIGLFITGRPTQTFLVQDAAFEMQGGRLFVVGRVSEAYDKYVWAKGKPSAIAWDCVDYYIVFDSVEQYREEIQRWRAMKAEEHSPAAIRRFMPWSRK
jgi:hypothetical protein